MKHYHDLISRVHDLLNCSELNEDDNSPEFWEKKHLLHQLLAVIEDHEEPTLPALGNGCPNCGSTNIRHIQAAEETRMCVIRDGKVYVNGASDHEDNADEYLGEIDCRDCDHVFTIADTQLDYVDETAMPEEIEGPDNRPEEEK